MNKDAESMFRAVPVVPVVVIEDAHKAGALAAALGGAGLAVIEVTLRTPAALAAISAMRQAAPAAVIGAGSVLSPEQLEMALAAGAQFVVSPGSTPRLLQAFSRCPVPCLPGIATASEAMAARESGFRAVKFFPAEAMGGVKTLAGWQGPLADMVFCPTGGIDAAKAPSYLALRNVLCVGGSWMVPQEAVASGDFARIERLAGEAASLGKARG